MRLVGTQRGQRAFQARAWVGPVSKRVKAHWDPLQLPAVLLPQLPVQRSSDSSDSSLDSEQGPPQEMTLAKARGKLGERKKGNRWPLVPRVYKNTTINI